MTDRTLYGWTTQGERIIKKFVFRDFKAAIRFIDECAIFCDETDHHPEWKNIYNQIWVELTTHDKGGVTEKDYLLAEHMDKLFIQINI